MKTNPDVQHAIEKYNGLHDNLDAYGKLVLRYLRNRDVTPQQAEAMRQRYLTMYQSWIDARLALRSKFPRTTSAQQRPLPWNNRPLD